MNRFKKQFIKNGITVDLINEIKVDLGELKDNEIYKLKLELEDKKIEKEKFNNNTSRDFCMMIISTVLGITFGAMDLLVKLGIEKLIKIVSIIYFAIIVVSVISFCFDKMKVDAIRYYTFYLKLIEDFEKENDINATSYYVNELNREIAVTKEKSKRNKNNKKKKK